MTLVVPARGQADLAPPGPLDLDLRHGVGPVDPLDVGRERRLASARADGDADSGQLLRVVQDHIVGAAGTGRSAHDRTATGGGYS